ncbi:MAG: hypothetical protein GY861_09935 [bacterium]|nr:hypothetical protein [bacterium]
MPGIKYVIGAIIMLLLLGVVVSGSIMPAPEIISNLNTWIEETLGIGEKGACAKAEDAFWCKNQNMCMIETEADVCNPSTHEPTECDDFCDRMTCTVHACEPPMGCIGKTCTFCATEGDECGKTMDSMWFSKGSCCDGYKCRGKDWLAGIWKQTCMKR